MIELLLVAAGGAFFWSTYKSNRGRRRRGRKGRGLGCPGDYRVVEVRSKRRRR